jgi:hypothetical protein
MLHNDDDDDVKARDTGGRIGVDDGVQMSTLNIGNGDGGDHDDADMESLLPQDDFDDNGKAKRQSLEALLPGRNGGGDRIEITDGGVGGGGGGDVTSTAFAITGGGPLAKYVDSDPRGGGRSSSAASSIPSTISCGCFQIHPYRIGNFTLLFPEHFDTGRGWGVVGPHWFGPACVWGILVGATHLCLRGVYHKNLGWFSAAMCYFFFGLCTWRLTEVSLRDPGICLHRERPTTTATNNNNDYRFCDRCQIWQPPDGIHCPECNCCIAGKPD